MATLDTSSLTVPFGGVGRGLRHWWRDYQSMVRWHLASLRIWFLTLLAVQVLSGVGFVLGISLFFHHIPTSAALYVSTGVPVINILMVGLIFGPQLVASQSQPGVTSTCAPSPSAAPSPPPRGPRCASPAAPRRWSC